MRICFAEIERCRRVTPRPNFIILLGDRYGWQPLPEEIPASEFEQIEQRIGSDAERSLLAAWYKRDNNAVPPHRTGLGGVSSEIQRWVGSIHRVL